MACRPGGISAARSGATRALARSVTPARSFHSIELPPRAEGGVELDERGGARFGESTQPATVSLVELGHDAQQGSQAVDGYVHVVRLVHAKRPRGTAGHGECVEPALGIEAVDELEQHREEIDARAVDVDAQLEAEPVDRLVARLDARIPERLTIDDPEWVGRVDLDSPAEGSPRRNGPGGKRAERVLVAVGAHDVVGLAAVRGSDGVETRQLHCPEPFENAPRVVLHAPIALDGLETARVEVEDARALVGGADPRAGVVEAQGKQRDESVLDVARQALGPRDRDVVREKAHTGSGRAIARRVRQRARGGERHELPDGTQTKTDVQRVVNVLLARRGGRVTAARRKTVLRRRRALRRTTARVRSAWRRRRTGPSACR